MNILIKNANVVDSSQNFIGDVYIENGKIKELGTSINKNDVDIIDAKGLTLMPAFVDTHAHFRDPGLTYKEDLETGSRAALRGGYTGVCLMGNTSPTCSTKEVLDYVKNKEENLKLIDIHQCVTITKDFDGKTLSHLEEFKNDQRVKAISDDGVGVSDSRVMMEAMKIAKENDWVIMSHAESHEFSDIDMRLAENMMTWRDITLAKVTGAKLHMAHVSTKEAMKYIIDGKCSGVNVTCEVTPHHIALTNDKNNYRVNPPIREKSDVDFLLRAISHGDVECIGTDHAPHTKEDKEKGSPGMVGLETAFPICYTKLVKEGVITINKLSEMMSRNPAKILKMNKGNISIGLDGDVVLLDLNKEITINSDEFYSKGKNTPFEGMKYYGEVVMTIKGGQVLYKK
ncbi:dihydroorotase [Clostridium baratii]|uniref:dihydroorotase n=1 Tax=Clostridium baratii TaxID=1561 RepID=UPI0009A308B6|nr:dihydroorotase [Clostridium baratii]OPF52463.1 dihydroorotase [Clostridium baratii]OPF55912.1 dihydroorotase [Clostridium baratii]OPF56707.1 dihydroorotase [Clostridium baratii]OPF59706.1 dihydroorotase [Clostridium baratii]